MTTETERPADEDIVDVLVIGGGPAGATAALYAARAGRTCHVIDKGIAAGALGMSREIGNFPGLIDPVPGVRIVSSIRTQAERYGAVFVADRVTAATLDGSVKTA
ncbi:MAG: FAD-dependent oxidoreductase, partial [bacterium]